jgi:cytochrome P450
MIPLIPLLLALLTIYLTYTNFAHPLSSIPGPFLARFSRLWLIQHSLTGDLHTTMIALHARYGPLVRTARNEISISDPTSLKYIYGAGTKFRKSDWYSVWQGHRKFDLFGGRDEALHGKQRRLVSNIYSMADLKKLEPAVDTAIGLVVKRLGEVGGRGKHVDVGKWAQLFAFDVIGLVTFSKPFGFLAAGNDDGSFAAIDEALKSASWIGQVPWLFWLHDFMMPVIGGNWLGVNNRNGSLRQFAKRECDRKEQGMNDILTSLKKVQDAKPQEFSDEDVLSMASSNIFAGSDTTGITIGAVLYNLCKHPRCRDKLIQEIQNAVQREGLDETDNMPFDVGFAMPYLQACIYEALRVHPAVGMSLPRVVPPEGYEVEGRFMPGGVSGQLWSVEHVELILTDDHRSEPVGNTSTERNLR